MSIPLQMPTELLLVLDDLPRAERALLPSSRFHIQYLDAPTNRPDSAAVLSHYLETLDLGAAPATRLTLKERLSLKECLARGVLGAVYRAEAGVVVKLVSGAPDVATLLNEALVYQYATRLQGTVLPRCHGFYTTSAGDAALLVLEDCGRPPPIPDFAALPTPSKLAVMRALKQLHDAELEHGDVQPWNILNHPGGGVRLVGLNLAMVHECPARRMVMTEEYCFREAVGELLCEELIAVGDQMRFASQDEIAYA